MLANKGLQIIKDFDFDEGDDLDFGRISLSGDQDVRVVGKDVHVYYGEIPVAILENMY